MAGLALRPVTPAMDVLQLVAVGANHCHVLVALPGVAGIARNLFVGTLERELRLGVIVGFDLAPSIFGVTALAFLAEIAFMRIKLLVAVKALARRLAVYLFRLMAVFASYGLVRTI